MATNKPVIWVGRKQEYFSAYGWTAQISLNPFDKIARPRTGFRGCLRSRESARLPNPAKSGLPGHDLGWHRVRIFGITVRLIYLLSMVLRGRVE
jgi:hypothetical protein